MSTKDAVTERLEAVRLNRRVQELEEMVASLLGRSAKKPILPPEEQPDYIPHGSTRHAALLGLTEDGEGGWKLDDPLQYAARFGAQATPEFLDMLLKQKINELTTVPKVPANAPDLWIPPDAGREIKGIV